MDFSLTPEQELFQRTMREFAEREIVPRAREFDEREEFPLEIVRHLRQMGLLGLIVPEQYGGAGGSYLDYALALEEVSWACAATGVIMSVNNSLVCQPLLHHGSEAQKRHLLPSLAAGERLGAYALTEPGAGSDAAAITTTAARQGDLYVLNGTKVFITNGAEADLFVVFASTDLEQRSHGITAFLVDRDTPGFSISGRHAKLGIHASSTVELVFQDCAVAADRVLGTEGGGFRIAMETLDGGRIGIASQALGIARASLEASTSYAKERRQFGRPIAEFQTIQFYLADMALQLDAARLLTWRAAWLKDQGLPHTQAAAMAKLFASETAMAAAHRAVQIHGGYGYMRECAVERYFRDAKVTEIYEGTSEIQRLVIARHVLGNRT